MNCRFTSVPFLIFLILSTLPLSAQFFGPGRGSSGGVFAVASPVQSGRQITVAGRLTPLSKIVHGIPVAGYVDGVLVSLGDRVNKGTPLVRITREAVGETFRPVLLESRISGVVSDIQVFEQQQVNAGTAAVTILDDRGYLLEAAVSDRDALAVKSLGNIGVSGRSSDGNTYNGKILRLSQEPDYSTGLFTLTLEFPRQRGLFLGAVLFVDLSLGESLGISVEKTALVRREGEALLWLINSDNQLFPQKVTSGKEDGENIFITHGLSPGDRYIRRPNGKEEEGMSLREFIQANMNGGSGQGRD